MVIINSYYKCVIHKEQHNGRLWDARWQQTYKVNFHCLRSSERAHITENN